MQYFYGTCKEIGEEVVRAIQNTGVRADVAAFWRIKHLEGTHGLKHYLDRSTKIVNRAHCRSIDQDSRLSDNQG
jgi:hypothetical protein